ncbi:MAG: hypothetical protein Kow0068_14700 [Marinilabiliales bacterium]
MKTIYFLFIFYFLFFAYLPAQEYSIKVNFTNLKNVNVYLGYHYEDKTFLIDTVRVSENGDAIFKGEKQLHKGIYFIALPSFSYFDFLIDDKQNFSIFTDTTNFIDNLKFENSEINSDYIAYQKVVLNKYNKIQNYNSKLKTVVNKDSIGLYQDIINQLYAEINQYRYSVIQKNKNNILGKLILAMLQPGIPDEIRNSNNNQLINNYLKEHFFDNYDFSEQGLLYSSILNNKIYTFFKQIVEPEPDIITNEAIKLIEKSKVNEETYRFVLSYLISLFEATGNYPVEKAFVEIAEKYFLNSNEEWISDNLKNQLQIRVETIKPLMIGKVAPDMFLFDMEEQEVCLHQINHEFIVLYFYDIECGHCAYYTPLLHDICKKMQDYNIGFVAIYTESDFDAWKEYIETNEFTDWYNLYDATGYEDIINKYDIFKTPRVYILDKTHRIIAKDIEIEILDKYLDSLFNK